MSHGLPNKKSPVCLPARIACLILLLLCAPRVRAANPDPVDWMGQLGDQVSLTQISIPGTHDSATSSASSFMSKCQTYTIAQQLEQGVRFLDIRVIYNTTNNQLELYHGVDNLGLSLKNVFTDVKTFLDAHPTETVLYRFMREDSTKLNLNPDNDHDDAFYFNQLQSDLNTAGLGFYDLSTIGDFTLGTNRGRAIIIDYQSKNTTADHNMAAYNVRTSPFRGPEGRQDYLSAQTADKFANILANDVAAWDPDLINTLSLNSSGGTELFAGIPIPNPHGFTEKFATEYYASVSELIEGHAPFVVMMDFEEEFAAAAGGVAGDFYMEIINRNFMAAVPEPAECAALAGLAMLAAAALRRLKR